MENLKVIKKNDKKVIGIFYLIVSIFLLISGICLFTYKAENNRNNVFADEYPFTNNWISKEWLGFQLVLGNGIWTVDGSIYYFSDSTEQYYLYDGNIWTTKVWTGLTNFNGSNVWTDGTNIYFSSTTYHYVLDISTSTWTTKVWTGLTNFNGSNVWTDGTNIYYSSGLSQFVLSRIGSSGGDSVVYSFNGANVTVPVTFGTSATGDTYLNSSYINYLEVKLTFGQYTELQGYFYLQFDFNYIYTYNNSQSFRNFPTINDTLSYPNYTSNYLYFNSSTYNGVTYDWYGFDYISSNSYYNILKFSYTFSSNFTDFNFVGVRFFSDYAVVDNMYFIQNHIRYFDVDNAYFDISFPLYSTSLNAIEMFDSRYYYFDRNIDTTSETYQNGYDAGYSAGNTAGQSTGYDSGYNAGYSSGYSAGQTAGSSSGFDSGYQTGYNTGYATGYSAGTDASNAYTFTALIGSVIDVPISYFRSLWNFNLLGVNMLNFFLALFTLAIILFVIKLILGNK